MATTSSVIGQGHGFLQSQVDTINSENSSFCERFGAVVVLVGYSISVFVVGALTLPVATVLAAPVAAGYAVVYLAKKTQEFVTSSVRPLFGNNG
jgi:hypothetical protein